MRFSGCAHHNSSRVATVSAASKRNRRLFFLSCILEACKFLFSPVSAHYAKYYHAQQRQTKVDDLPPGLFRSDLLPVEGADRDLLRARANQSIFIEHISERIQQQILIRKRVIAKRIEAEGKRFARPPVHFAARDVAVG